MDAAFEERLELDQAAFVRDGPMGAFGDAAPAEDAAVRKNLDDAFVQLDSLGRTNLYTIRAFAAPAVAYLDAAALSCN